MEALKESQSLISKGDLKRSYELLSEVIKAYSCHDLGQQGSCKYFVYIRHNSAMSDDWLIDAKFQLLTLHGELSGHCSLL